MQYVRVVLRLPSGCRRIWAIKGKARGKLLSYTAVDQEGSRLGDLYLVYQSDVVRELPARMNNHYGALEVA